MDGCATIDGWMPPEPPPGMFPPPEGEPERPKAGIPLTWQGLPLRHRWEYRAADGSTLGIVGRYDGPAGKQVVPFFKLNGSGWKPGAAAEPRPLYGLDVLAKNPDGKAVVICEGERCASSLQSLGIVAVTSQGGSKAAARADWTPLSGVRKVYVLPDADEPGAQYARDVCEALRALESPPALYLVTLPGLPEAGDCVDWLMERCPGWDGFTEIPESESERLFVELRAAIREHAKPAPEASVSGGDAWGEPIPLAAKTSPAPYPLDALPGTVRAAVEEVAGFVRSPVALVAGSAVATLSLAGQAFADVQRAEGLQGPSSLYVMAIAESGERKSTGDGFFTRAVRDYQDTRAAEMKPEVEKYEAELAGWIAIRDGVLAAIREAAKKGKSPVKLREDLAILEHEKPKPPRVPRYLLMDETPEALASTLARQWPTAGVFSTDASLVLGSHGMGRDSIMRNLGLLNLLWDGAPVPIGRKTSESFTVKGVRLTSWLMIQDEPLRAFVTRSGKLARGTGYFARFLLLWPESTQGTRFFREPPAGWPRVAAFHRRITEILGREMPMDDEGVLSPAVMTLSPEAKRRWIAFHDGIEAELGTNGELFDVRDVASKTADNAVRLAALFELFERGHGVVSGDSFERASRIVAWHLGESRRYFGDLAQPQELADAWKLDAWLLDYCRANRIGAVSTREVQRLGPVRDGDRLAAAWGALEELGRLMLERDGKRKTVKVHPALIG